MWRRVIIVKGYPYLPLVLALLMFCCSPQEKQKDGVFYIVTTTGMIADAAKNITGDSAKVKALMGPGVDPHLYKVSQGDLSKLINSDMIFYNGLHLEGKMGEVLESVARQKPVVAIAEGLEEEKLRNVSGFSGGYDPHIWFDVQLWKEAVRYMSQKIIEQDPSNAEYYKKNTEQYLAKLDSLHQLVKREIALVPKNQRVLITAHDAFGYFGDAYDIEVKGLQGISTVSEPGLKDISEITDLIVNRKINAIFVESSVSEKTIKSVVEGAREKGHNVRVGGTLYSDALGDEDGPAGTYEGMVQENVKTIVTALR